MNNKKRKIILISAIILISFIVISFAYTLVTGKLELFNKTTTGTVQIETLNLTFSKLSGEKVDILEPADVCKISWQTKNIGTSGILTRHTLEIYWNDETNENSAELLKLYPANLSKEQILSDYSNLETNNYLIQTEKVSKKVDNKTLYGIKYSFVGDTLKGTNGEEISKEQNYNNENFENTTDDNDSTYDSIAFRLLLSPDTSYLYQNKKLSVYIVTEAMQYTENGSEQWEVVDTKKIQ